MLSVLQTRMRYGERKEVYCRQCTMVLFNSKCLVAQKRLLQKRLSLLHASAVIHLGAKSSALMRRNSIATVPIKRTGRQVPFVHIATRATHYSIIPLFILRRSNSAHLGGARASLIAAAGGTRALYFRRRDKLASRHRSC